MRVPEDLKRREVRLAAIAEAKPGDASAHPACRPSLAAKGKIEARAAERYAREQADYQAKLAARGALRRGQREEARRPGPQAARARPARRGPD
jgi:hypothetical protein